MISINDNKKYTDKDGNTVVLLGQMDAGNFRAEIVDVNPENLPIQKHGDTIMLKKGEFTPIKTEYDPKNKSDEPMIEQPAYEWFSQQVSIGHDNIAELREYFESGGFNIDKHYISADNIKIARTIYSFAVDQRMNESSAPR